MNTSQAHYLFVKTTASQIVNKLSRTCTSFVKQLLALKCNIFVIITIAQATQREKQK